VASGVLTGAGSGGWLFSAQTLGHVDDLFMVRRIYLLGRDGGWPDGRDMGAKADSKQNSSFGFCEEHLGIWAALSSPGRSYQKPST
jgi:hypothetical protein